MTKIFFYLFTCLFFFTTICFSQKTTPDNLGGVFVAENVNSLSRYTGNSEQLFVKDSVRGGIFYRYNGTLPADGGMILATESGIKWKRYTADNRIRPEWFGAGPSNPDNYAAFMAAIKYIYATDKNLSNSPQFANGILQLSGVQYNFSKTLVFDRHIKIEGQGTRYEPATVLHFPPNTTGINFIETTVTGAYSADMKNVCIVLEAAPAQKYDSSAHGISVSCVVNFENVSVSFASGDGIHIDACASPTAPHYGNADASMLINCKVIQCNNGVFVNGCDANQIVFQSLWAVANRRWGVYDNGFLGNHYYNPQCDFNGNRESIVTYGSKTYLAINAEELVNRNQIPGTVNSAYWQEISPRPAAAWNAAKKYYTGGAYAIVNPNASALVVGAYTEEGEAPAFLNHRVINIGGDQGSDVIGGSYLHASYDGLLLNSNLTLTGGNKLGVGIAPRAPLEVNYSYKDEHMPYIAKFNCVDCPSTNLVFANSVDSATGKYGFIGYYGKSFITSVEDTYINTVDLSGVLPYTNNKFSLGSNSLKWKNVYASNFLGGDWNGAAINPAFGGTGLSTVAPYALLVGGATATGNLQQITPGNSGQVLTSNGPGALPAWQNPSTTVGVSSFPSKLTTADRNKMTKPVEGQVIYNLTTHKLNVFTGTVWEEMASH